MKVEINHRSITWDTARKWVRHATGGEYDYELE